MSKPNSDKLYEAWSALPAYVRGAISLVATAGIVWGGYAIYQWNEKRKLEKSANAVSDAANDEYKELLKTQKLSFPESSYLSTANTIQKLLNGCERITTEIQVVDEIGKLVRKKIDWLKLVSTFKSRDIEDCAYGKTNYDLITLVKDQLGSTLMGDLVLGKRYWNDITLVPLTDHLNKLGVTL